MSESEEEFQPSSSSSSDDEEEHKPPRCNDHYIRKKAWVQSQGPEDLTGPQLFLVPTGPVGVNDHCLQAPVTFQHQGRAHESYLWGFGQGMWKVFRFMKPGDVILFTASKSGKFALVATISQVMTLTGTEATQIWRDTVPKSLGAVSKGGFPLIVLLQPPVHVDFDKKTLMASFGYKPHDRLQSARRVPAFRPARTAIMKTLQAQLRK